MEVTSVYITKWINQMTGSLRVQGISMLAFLRVCSTNSHSRDIPQERLLWRNEFGKHNSTPFWGITTHNISLSEIIESATTIHHQKEKKKPSINNITLIQCE